jgi:hypothetical protein
VTQGPTQLDPARRLAASLHAARVLPAPAPPAGCSFPACELASQFQPCFVVDYGEHRVVVRDIPLRVCVEHRPGLEALFGSEAVHAWLHRKLHERGLEEPDHVRVVFEVVA